MLSISHAQQTQTARKQKWIGGRLLYRDRLIVMLAISVFSIVKAQGACAGIEDASAPAYVQAQR
jgi:hypothetical protein